MSSTSQYYSSFNNKIVKIPEIASSKAKSNTYITPPIIVTSATSSADSFMNDNLHAEVGGLRDLFFSLQEKLNSTEHQLVVLKSNLNDANLRITLQDYKLQELNAMKQLNEKMDETSVKTKLKKPFDFDHFVGFLVSENFKYQMQHIVEDHALRINTLRF